jgi:hypothetical protein
VIAKAYAPQANACRLAARLSPTVAISSVMLYTLANNAEEPGSGAFLTVRYGFSLIPGVRRSVLGPEALISNEAEVLSHRRTLIQEIS